jgi:D-alanine--poly(phosphoribitol) ligase subunit 2
MEQKQKIINLVFSVIDEINKELSKDEHIIKSLDSVIYGSNGQLDSLGLVNFVVAVEQKIEDVFEKSINLADDKAMSEKNSPFQTIETFVNYIYDVLEKM